KGGEVFFGAGGKTYKAVGEGQSSEVDAPTFQSVGSDGRHYFVEGNKLRAVGSEGKSVVVAKGIKGGVLACAHNGNIYVAEEDGGKRRSNAIWLVKPDGSKHKVDDAAICWGGIALSPDQTLLYASDSESHWVYSYQIQPDGTLAHGQKYYWLHSPDTADDSGARGMQVDSEGRLYVATRMGVQVCDQAGRVNVILPTPAEGAESLVIGGAEFDTVFVQAGNKLYKRKLKIKGFAGADAPVKPAAPRL
ncbi:MAG: gluconolactonase, partial [Verrucomicrobia bacterium]|nr:gluconolactonase [Verrucomicrobiota bacterium]